MEHTLDSLEGVSGIAVDSTGTRLFIVHRKLFGMGQEGYLYQPEVVVLDLSGDVQPRREVVNDAVRRTLQSET